MMFITIGLLGLTVLYVGMVLALHYLLPISVDCFSFNPDGDGIGDEDGDANEDEGYGDGDNSLCQTEGVDNTILNWSSDFFISLCFFIFAFQLSCCPSSSSSSSSSSSFKKGKRVVKETTKKDTVCYKSGILLQIFMGGSFLLQGIGSVMYPNSGIDDNHGLMGYFILNIIAKIFYTLSGLCMAKFALDTTSNITVNDSCCFIFCSSFRSKIWLALCEFVLVLSLSGILTGSIWCSTDPALQVNDVNDVWLPTNETAVCFTITKYSDIVLHFSYALLWLPVGYLLRVASIQKPTTVLGLPTPISAVLAIIIQWSIGSMLVVFVFLTGTFMKINNDEESFYTIYFMIWNTIYGTVLYHWGMLITMYCLHNLSYGLTVPVYGSNNEDNEDDRPSVLSTEWWLSLVAYILPAATKKSRNDTNDDDDDDVIVVEEEEQKEAAGAAAQTKRAVSFEDDVYIVEEEIDV
jgi:hypothetical protein